jgi:hypothetical protein
MDIARVARWPGVAKHETLSFHEFKSGLGAALYLGMLPAV